MPELSIIIPTCQRAQLLERCLVTIEQGTHCDFELIVVDGASTDATPGVLGRAKQWLGDKLKIIREERREGFTRALNKGFRAATGRHFTWLNDDARPLPQAMDQALEQITQAKADVGMLALFHDWHGTRNVAYETRISGRVYRLLHVHGTLCANFGIARRETFSSLGYFDERYYVKEADSDFSLKVWHAGMKVEPAYMTAIDHDEVDDARRHADAERGKDDLDRLLAKWDLPARTIMRNEFDPGHPCTLRGRHDASAVAI